MKFKQICITMMAVALVIYLTMTFTSVSLQAEVRIADQGGKLALELKK